MRSTRNGKVPLSSLLSQTARNIEERHLQKTLFTYIVSIILSLLAVLFSVLLSFLYGIAIPIPLIPAVTLSAWFGNGRTGILTTVATAGVFYYLLAYRFPLLIRTYTAVEFALLSLSALLLSVVIDQAKRMDSSWEFKKKERFYAKLLAEAGITNKSLVNQLKARDEFLSIVSHELKTPLTSMLLQLQTALHNISNVSLAHFSVQNLMKMLQSAREQSERLSKMINDLLNISLITTGRFDLEREKIDLTKLVQEILLEFKDKTLIDGYAINFDPQKPVDGYWDRLRIEQVTTNLLTNAIKYGNKKPIDISVTTSRGYAVLTVTDHGIGIRPDQRKHIFDRFQRAVSAKHYQGFGVGLYITQQIVNAHLGTIDVKSSRKRGTSFIVKLPLRNALVKDKSLAKS